MSDRVVDVAAATDPVAAVLAAHDRGDLIALRTSGTSRSPRAVVRTTHSWWNSFDHVTGLLGMDRASRVWIPGTLGSTMNLFAAVHAAAMGASVVDRPKDATHAVLTPAALTRAIAHGADLSEVHVLAAGDALSLLLRERATRAGAREVSHYYGAAELSFVAWGSHALDLRPFPGVEVECRDGLVWARSPYLCRGYDGPDGPLTRAPDGFVTVGDRGHIEDGRLVVQGRSGDAVVTAGATVLAADVEAALERATGQRIVVVGLPHPDLGQVLCAVVEDGSAVPALKECARRLLEPAQRPRRWFEVAQLPVTTAGKVDRDRLVGDLNGSTSIAVVPS